MLELTIAISLYLILFNSILFVGLKRLFNYNKVNNFKELYLSVIVAAKDEEKNLPFLIDKLSKQNYTNEKFEVIIVDDNSCDSTYSRITELTANLSNYSVLKTDNKIFSGKRGALQLGIEKAKHDNILIIDADCQPQPEWLSACSKIFNEGFDFIFGFAPFFQTKGFTNFIACFENLRTTFLTFSSAGLGFPYSAAARNFGFIKDAFKKVGGFSNTLDAISGDDDLLLREAIKHNLKIGVVTDKGSYVFSRSKEKLNEYFDQKARHTSTSYKYLFKHKVFLGLWHIPNILVVISIPLYVFFPYLWIVLLVKLFLDFLAVQTIKKKNNYRFCIMQTWFFQVVYEVLLVVHFFNAKRKKIVWKGI